MRLAARMLLVVTLGFALSVPVAQSATAWTNKPSPPTATTSTAANGSYAAAVKWLGDNIALTQVQLSPSMKKFVNQIIKLVGPVMCPLLSKAAAADFRQLVLEGCKAMVASADPWSQLTTLIPLFCQLGDVIFPDFAKLLALACPLLI